MNSEDRCLDELTRRATGGDESALAEVFDRHRDRLRQMVRLRLDPRLQGRIDPSDVLQEAYVDLMDRLGEYEKRSGIPFFVWLRLVVSERLLRIHRQHLGAALRDARREISIHQVRVPQASSATLAAQLFGQITTPSQASLRLELQRLLEEALNSMEPVDREVIALRHYEELSNDEVAAALGLTKKAASKRYVRAMIRLKRVVEGTPGLADSSRGRQET
jgi:RNA polymerase sigma-70 factor (ECF subfamily)